MAEKGTQRKRRKKVEPKSKGRSPREVGGESLQVTKLVQIPYSFFRPGEEQMEKHADSYLLIAYTGPDSH